MGNEQERQLIVMRHEGRIIRFDVGEEEARISGLVRSKLKQADAPVEVAREFYAGLLEKDWNRDELSEQALKASNQ